jgi:DNA polymerase-3 subunit gamma/tau
MESQVFYRKWRPQTLGDVAGQEHVTQTLLNALNSGHVSHAYLFCGPRGTGKTSTGRILAKAVNCTGNGKGEPCNTCDMCLAITEGRAMDVIEIDAASNRGIDEIRELRERVNYAPGKANYKVYIIDEFHMLTKEASNALLKTLEEPPSCVIFILATTEVHKVLPTIMSRCQRFDFRRISQNDMMQKLQQICKSEGIKIKEEALNLIARNSTGSLRDAENLMEKLFTYYGPSVSLKQVQSVLGITGDERAKELVEHIVNGDLPAGIKTINSVNNDGFDLKQFNREIVKYLRGLLLIRNGYQKDLDFTTEEIAALTDLANMISTEQVLKAIKLFGKLELNLDNYSTLPLELALVDCSLSSSEGIKNAVQTPQFKSDVIAQAKTNIITSNKDKKHKPELEPEPEEELKPVIFDPKPVETETHTSYKHVTKEFCNNLEQLNTNWKTIIEHAPDSFKRSPALAILRSAGVKPVAFNDNTVVLSFRFPVHKDKIEETENNKIAAKIIGNFIGHPCEVRCIYEPEENHLVREIQRFGGQIVEVEEK